MPPLATELLNTNREKNSSHPINVVSLDNAADFVEIR